MNIYNYLLSVYLFCIFKKGKEMNFADNNLLLNERF